MAGWDRMEVGLWVGKHEVYRSGAFPLHAPKSEDAALPSSQIQPPSSQSIPSGPEECGGGHGSYGFQMSHSHPGVLEASVRPASPDEAAGDFSPSSSFITGGG